MGRSYRSFFFYSLSYSNSRLLSSTKFYHKLNFALAYDNAPYVLFFYYIAVTSREDCIMLPNFGVYYYPCFRNMAESYRILCHFCPRGFSIIYSKFSPNIFIHFFHNASCFFFYCRTIFLSLNYYQHIKNNKLPVVNLFSAFLLFVCLFCFF